MPDGNLICTRNGSHYKWYLSENHKLTYIPKKNRHLAEQLATKKYLSYVLGELMQERAFINNYFKSPPANCPEIDFGLKKSELLLTEDSGYRELLLPNFSLSSQEISQWTQAPYERNLKYPEQLIHKAASGNLVRSKSEVMIDMYLFTHRIPFRYECALTLGEITLFPDFTILHPKSKDIFYWEHFGRMDDENYSKNAFSKLQLYNSHGITPSIQLITTYETAENPLTIKTIQNVISQYFL